MTTERGIIRNNDDDDEGAGYGKLIPEWGVRSDEQIIWVGLLVVALLGLGMGWNLFFGGDDDLGVDLAGPATTLGIDEGDTGDGDDEGLAPAVVPVPTTQPEEDEPATSEAPTSTQAPAVIGDVQAAVDPFPGAITGSNNGATAVLTGYVANQAESDEAEAAALTVEGIESVDNQLQLLEGPVSEALVGSGVTGASVSGLGTVMTVSGFIESEDARQPALDAAAAVPGVTEVKDNTLEVSVTADLNALPQVKFATGSATILLESYTDLDAAAELLKSAGDDAQIEIQGYTDIRGDDAYNLKLSQDRTESVRQYLIDKGVNADVLIAKGYGETEQFGEGETAEALAANRLVRFQQIG